ncbi:MAG: ATP-dependent helicase [Bacteroidetes bacterium]|nr:ATP-dependent helicase [Bacteroidota bacterium]
MTEGNQTIKSYNQTFLQEIDRLNEAQSVAVEQIEGPVLVIAGPGTGKTHILTARIGNILMKTDARPFNILCLTFTDAGVRAMRERLLEFIGPEAHKVHIYTFHSFCNSIIQDNLELFGRHDLEPLSELERVEIIRKVIEDLGVHHPLKQGRSDIYFYENHLYDLFGRMKRENWTREYVNEKADEYLASLHERKEFVYQINRGNFRKGELKKAKVEEAQIRMMKLKTAAALYPVYQEALKKARRYDYDDMILWVLRAFEKNEVLLRSYQEQYLYFLVDEYQDTNGAQNEVVKKLTEYWEVPNIFIVGDDDQSIFEFQGARLKNLTDFYHLYSDSIQLVLLKDNYRSSQLILDSSHGLISHNKKRIVSSLSSLGIEKLLNARNEKLADSAALPVIAEYPNRLHEVADIVDQIDKLKQQGISLKEVTVIYAKHKQAEYLIQLLQKKGIPYHTRRKVNILDLPFIRNLLTMLEYLHSEIQKAHSAEHLLFRILHFRYFGILPADIARLSVFMASHRKDGAMKWRNHLGNKKALDKVDLENKAAIQSFVGLVNELLADYNAYPILKLIEKLINRSGLLGYVLESEERTWWLQVLNTFMDFVRQETDRNPRLSVGRLLDIFRNMDANRLPVEVNKVIQAEEGIHLLTAHSAKGLEFEYVFLLDCVKDHWEPGRGRGAFRFPFPDTLTYSGEEDAMEARRRLFYVAMTRAKSFLHISYSRQDAKGKDLQQAVFIDEILTADKGSFEKLSKTTSEEILTDAQLWMLQEMQKPAVQLFDHTEISRLLENFTLSISALNEYLRCPLSFYYAYVLKVPTEEREAASYGTAMHNALQRLFEKMLLSKPREFGGSESLVQLFELEMKNRKGRFSKKEFQRRLEMGRRYLKIFYEQNVGKWGKKAKVEYKIKNATVEGVPVTGVIDLLEFQKNAIHVLDYKTGSINKSKTRGPTKKNPNGGTYWRQLVFYKLLFENHRKWADPVKTAQIAYLTPDMMGVFPEYHLKYTAKDVEVVSALIIESYQRIKEHKFTEGCGEKNCVWCNFTRQNLPAEQSIPTDTFANIMQEEMDD